jgi:hypothetical protein
MPDADHTLLSGRWVKISSSSCGKRYPSQLEFHPNGLFYGASEPPGRFVHWDAGTFEVDETAALVRLSTANDAILTYPFRLLDNELHLWVEHNSCELIYQKIPP